MATIPQVQPKRQTDETLAGELLGVMEGYFDDVGLTTDEREKRYAALRESLDLKDELSAKS